MGNDNNNNDSLFPKSVDNAVNNILDEPTKSIGQTFSDIWYLILGGPMQYKRRKREIKYEKDLERYRKEIECELRKIPEDKRADPDIQIVGQALNASLYCVENEAVRQMFVKLITSTMNYDLRDKSHPIFIDILSKMNPLDAYLFKVIAKERGTFITVHDRDEFSMSLATLLQTGLIYIHNEELNFEIEAGNNFNQTLIQLKKHINEIYQNVTTKIKEDDCTIWRNQFHLTYLGEQMKKVCID